MGPSSTQTVMLRQRPPHGSGADYYSPLSQTEIITSENDGKAAGAQQLYFPTQLGGRKPSDAVNNSTAPP